MNLKAFFEIVSDSGFKSGLSVLSSSTKTFLGIGTAITAIAAAYEGFKLLDDKFTLTFATAQKHMEESASAYESNYSELQSINSELETTSSRIAELKSQGTLTIAEEAELAKLERQNSLLEAQQKLKQSATDAAQKQAATDAATSINFKSEKSTQTRTDKNGMDMEVAIDRKEYVREQVALMEEAQRQIDQATEKINSGDKSKKWEEQLKTASDNLNTYKENATNTLSDLNSEAENLYDESTGNVIKGYEGLVNEIDSLNNLVNNFDLSGIEKNQAAIESFFDGSTKSNAIKEKLLEAVKSGESATDALHAMGITLNDLGITGEEKKKVFDDYFNGLIESSKEAENAIKSVDGTVNGVKAAKESANQDQDWSDMVEALENAKELYKKGKVGTDDFQTATQFMTYETINYDADGFKYDADAFVQYWQNAQAKVARYFDKNNPLQSVLNFSNDLVNSGLATKVGDEYTWGFKNSAQAAKELGISVEAVETLMHSLESYGAEFDDVLWSGEGIENYKSYLEEIKEVYKSIEDEQLKERFKKIIDDADLADLENNIENLTPEIVADLKFEADLASLQKAIDELQNGIDANGGSAEEWGALVAAQKSKRDKLASQEGMETATSDVGYQTAGKAIDDLSQKLKTNYNELGEKGRRSISMQQNALVELQNSFLEMSAKDGSIDWNSFLKTDEANNVFDKLAEDSGKTSEQVKKDFEELMSNTEFDIDDSKAKEKIDGVLSNDGKTIIMKVEASTEDIQEQIAQLQNGQSLLFTAEVDGDKNDIKAVKRQTGEIVYTAVIDDVQYYLEEVKNEDGTISYTLGDYPKEVPPADQEVHRTPDNSDVSTDPSPVGQSVKRTPDNSDVMRDPPSVTQKVIRSISNTLTTYGSNTHSMGGRGGGGGGQVSGTMISPAHASGTAYNMLNLKHAYANGKIALDRDETALINEIGQESIVRDGKWMLVPGGMHMENLKKGDIILNAQQTSDLIKGGKAFGHARAYASGTLLSSAYANGFRLPSSNGKSYSSTTTKKKSSSKKSSSKKSTTKKKTSSSSSKVSKKLEKIINSLEKLFDWIEVKVQRLEDRINLNLAKADNATTYTSKNAYVSKAQTDTATLLATQQKAVTKYTSKANAVAKKVGLSSSLKKKVDNGTIDIQSLSENNKKRVEEYKQWVDKINEARQAVEDLKQQQKELAQQKLDNIIEQYDTIVNLAESVQKVSETMVNYYTSMGKAVDSNEAKKQIQSQMTQQNNITANLQDQYNAYKAELANAAKVFGTNSNEYREAAEKLNDINASLYESKTAYNDLNKQLNELDLSRIQYAIDNLKLFGDKMKSMISLLEKRGGNIQESDYTKQINNNNNLIEQYYKDRQNRMDMIAKNGWEVGSEQYQEYYEAIMKDEEAIYSLLEANEDLKASIVELRWKPFNDLQEKLSQAIDDYDFLRSLLNEEGFYDENGALTSEGQANIALIGKAMATAKQQIADYREALNKLQEEYENGNIALDEYNERSREYIETIQDSVSTVKDYEKALLDMYKTRITKENDALQEHIDLQKERNSEEKEYWDYAESLKDKTKTVNELESRIAVLKGVNNSQAKAELKRLEEQKKQAEKELENTKRDHQYDMTQKGYDLMSENAEKSLNSTLDALETNSEKQQEVVNEMLDQIKNSYSSAYDEINGIISETGTVISKEAQDAIDSLNNATDALNTANSAQSKPTDKNSNSQVSNINTDEINTGTARIDDIESSINGNTSSEIQSKTDAENARKAEEDRIAAEAKAKAEEEAKLKAEEEARKAKLAKVKSVISGNKYRGKISSSEYKKHADLWKYIYDKSKEKIHITEDNQLKIGQILGVSGLPKKGSDLSGSNKNAILKALKAVGYYNGTRRVPKDQLALLDDTKDGGLDLGSEVIITEHGILEQVKAGTTVFNSDQVQKLWDWSNGNFDATSLMNLNTGNMLGQLPEIINRNDMSKNSEINLNFESLITIESGANVAKEAIPGLQKEIDKMIPHISDRLGVYVKNEMRL